MLLFSPNLAIVLLTNALIFYIKIMFFTFAKKLSEPCLKPKYRDLNNNEFDVSLDEIDAHEILGSIIQLRSLIRETKGSGC